MFNSTALVICITSGVIYLLCDYLQRFAAVMELARLAFAVAALALLLGGK